MNAFKNVQMELTTTNYRENVLIVIIRVVFAVALQKKIVSHAIKTLIYIRMNALLSVHRTDMPMMGYAFKIVQKINF
jgi:hypothetical protein